MSLFADSNRVGLRFIAESTWGTTPASGTTRVIRLTSSSLAVTKETVVSDELRADRMVGAVVEVAAMTEGDISFEYSAGSVDAFLQAFVLGTFTRPMTFDRFNAVAWTANNTIRIPGLDRASFFTVGRRIKTDGFVTPINNGYWEITSATFTGGNTDIVVTTTVGVIEAASAFTRVMDANDVIILRNTAIRAGTGAAQQFDSNGGNAFASAISAGQLRIGQKIFVEGLGYETGTVTFVTTVPETGDQVSVADGAGNLILFTFGTGTGQVNPGATVTTAATAFALAINNARLVGVNGVRINVAATASAGVVTIRNLNVTGGAIVEVTDGGTANITVVNFSGGQATARGVFTITGLTNDVITVAEPVATNANGGALPVSIKGSMLRNPGVVSELVPQSFTIETQFSDINQVLDMDGMRVGTFSLEVASGSIVTGTMSFMGRETTTRTNSLLGTAPYTVLDAPATEVMNATTNVGSLVKNGVALSAALQSITIEGDASLRAQNAVGSKFPRGIGTGRFSLTGTVSAYFQNLELFNHFLQHDTVSLGFQFSDLDGNAYVWTLPAIKFSTDPVAPGGIDQDIIETLEYTAFRDATTACMLQVDRFSSNRAI